MRTRYIIRGFVGLLLWHAISVPSVVAQVGVYNVFELQVSNSKSYPNPFDFNLVELRGTFTAPSKKQVKIFGFFDGDGDGGQTGNVWKLRFMPDEEGTWTYAYTWTDGTPGASGSFKVVGGSGKGPLKVDPLHPHSLIHANGQRFFWNGDTEWFFLSDSFTQTSRFAAIDFLASKKVNNLLMVMVNDDKYPVLPWVSRTDKGRFDLQRLKRWEAVIEYMKWKGMIADLWFYSDDSKALLPPPDSAAEDLYFKYIIARFAAYENVTWNLALEYEEYRTSSWVTKRAQFVKDRDPFDHLLAVHQLPSGSFAFPGLSNLDHTSLQHLGADHATLNRVVRENRDASASAGRPIPVMHEEFFIEGARGNPDQFRQGIWAVTTAGGYYKGASLGFWIGTSYKNALHFDVAKRLFEFIVTVPYWEMRPDNSVVSAGYALVNPGKDYLVYLPSGGSVTVNLAALSKSLGVKWYDPKTGLYSGHSTTIGGGNKAFTAPFSGDAVLYIGGGVSQGNLPPTATAAADVTVGAVPLTVNFTGIGSDSDGSITSFSWDFGDGSISIGQNPSHVYRSAGVFDAILKATDDKGAIGTAQVRIDASGTDTTPPTVVIVSPPDKTTVAMPSVSVTGTIADQNQVPVTVNVSVSPSDTNWVFPVLNGRFSGTVDLHPGLNIVSISATDSAGNFGTASISLTLGTGKAAPLAPINLNVR